MDVSVTWARGGRGGSSGTVVLENVGGGSKNAAPVARQIMDFYFRDRVFETADVNTASSHNKLGVNQ